MPNKVLLSSLVLFAALGADSADAAPVFTEGTHERNAGYACTQGDSQVLEAHASYETDTIADRAAATGEVRYLSAVAWNYSTCHADRVQVYFILPPGAVLATDQMAVKCFVGHQIGTQRTIYNVHDDPENWFECLQTPEVVPHVDGSTGYYFGMAPLPPRTVSDGKTWFLDFQVPVVYTRRLDGQPFRAYFHDDFKDLEPKVPVKVAFKPKFEDHRLLENSTGVSAKVNFDLTHYYEHGILDVFYGTSPSAMWYGAGAVATSTSLMSHPDSTATLTNLQTVTTYYWQVRITTNEGTWMGPMQSFTTPAASLAPSNPPTICWRRGC